jgi:hypothetical protein
MPVLSDVHQASASAKGPGLTPWYIFNGSSYVITSPLTIFLLGILCFVAIMLRAQRAKNMKADNGQEAEGRKGHDGDGPPMNIVRFEDEKQGQGQEPMQPLNFSEQPSFLPAASYAMPEDSLEGLEAWQEGFTTFEYTQSPIEEMDGSSNDSSAANGSLPRRRSYTKTSGEGVEVQGEILIMEPWRRHTRVYGGGVCLACLESEQADQKMAANA